MYLEAKKLRKDCHTLYYTSYLSLIYQFLKQFFFFFYLSYLFLRIWAWLSVNNKCAVSKLIYFSWQWPNINYRWPSSRKDVIGQFWVFFGKTQIYNEKQAWPWGQFRECLTPGIKWQILAFKCKFTITNFIKPFWHIKHQKAKFVFSQVK